jgi:hypothetical protein
LVRFAIGDFMLADMPQELWAKEALQERVAWMGNIANWRQEPVSDLDEVLGVDAEGDEP